MVANSFDSYEIGASGDTRDLLGTPLPNVTHGVSVNMPRWRDVVAYEEGDPAVHERLQSGYPRFVFHPIVDQLFRHYERCFACTEQEQAIVLVTQRAANRCQEFLSQAGFRDTRIEPCEVNDLFAVIYPKEATRTAKAFWQHTGWIVSSRCAEAILSGRREITFDDSIVLRTRIASYAGVLQDSLTLFPSGMAAIDTAHQILLALASERGAPGKGVQYGFPYLDTLKLQERFGGGVQLLARADAEDLRLLAELVAVGRVSHVFTEVPSNPLLQTPHLAALSSILRPRGIPLVVDDTIGTFFNVDVAPFADIVVTSLTKFISGGGDVAAGSLIVSPASPLAPTLASLRDVIAPRSSYLFGDDAEVLFKNSADFAERMARINVNAELLVQYLSEHPLVQTVYYPRFSKGNEYESLRKQEGGYGGLLSIALKDAAHTAPRLYDALSCSKGPGLGTSFTLACPYTLLAHYGELDWVEEQGVSRHLIRVSVGIENPKQIIALFDRALKQAQQRTIVGLKGQHDNIA